MPFPWEAGAAIVVHRHIRLLPGPGGEGWRWFNLKRTNTLLQRVLQHNNRRPYYVAINGDGNPRLAQDITGKTSCSPSGWRIYSITRHSAFPVKIRSIDER